MMLREAVSMLDPDMSRGDWLKIGLAIHHQTEGSEEGLEVFESWSRTGSKYEPGEPEKIWRDAGRKRSGLPVTAATIIKLACEKGWTVPAALRRGTSDDVIECFEILDPDPDAPEGKNRVANSRRKPTLRFRYAGEMSKEADAFDFVEGLLYERQLAVVSGAPGVGKTFFILDLAMHVALGRKWRDRGIERGGVLFITLEGADMQKRFRAWCQHHGVQPEEVPIAFSDGSLDLRKDELTRDAVVKFAEEAAAKWEIPVRWIVVDTLSRAMAGGNENAGEDMSALIDGAAKIAQATGANLTFIHHPGKDEARGMRAHSSLLGNTDTEILIERGEGANVARLKRQRKRRKDSLGDMGSRRSISGTRTTGARLLPPKSSSRRICQR
jgi:hypothetical protein